MYQVRSYSLIRGCRWLSFATFFFQFIIVEPTRPFILLGIVSVFFCPCSADNNLLNGIHVLFFIAEVSSSDLLLLHHLFCGLKLRVRCDSFWIPKYTPLVRGLCLITKKKGSASQKSIYNFVCIPSHMKSFEKIGFFSRTFLSFYSTIGILVVFFCILLMRYTSS